METSYMLVSSYPYAFLVLYVFFEEQQGSPLLIFFIIFSGKKIFTLYKVIGPKKTLRKKITRFYSASLWCCMYHVIRLIVKSIPMQHLNFGLRSIFYCCVISIFFRKDVVFPPYENSR